MDLVAATRDLTGDGIPDVLGRNASTKVTGLYPGTAQGTLGAPVLRTSRFATADQLVGALDMTGDGIPDVVARMAGSSTLWVYPGNGRGGFRRPGLVAGVRGPVVVGSAVGVRVSVAVVGATGQHQDGCEGHRRRSAHNSSPHESVHRNRVLLPVGARTCIPRGRAGIFRTYPPPTSTNTVGGPSDCPTGTGLIGADRADRPEISPATAPSAAAGFLLNAVPQAVTPVVRMEASSR